MAETKFRPTTEPQDRAVVLASTSPLVAICVLCSLAMSKGALCDVCPRDADAEMVFLDISRAHSPEEHPEHLFLRSCWQAA